MNLALGILQKDTCHSLMVEGDEIKKGVSLFDQLLVVPHPQDQLQFRIQMLVVVMYVNHCD